MTEPYDNGGFFHSGGRIVPLREMLDEETYRRYEPKWSALRMADGLEPLPYSWEAFKEYMGWDDDREDS